jgi:hypothetical protein
VEASFMTSERKAIAGGFSSPSIGPRRRAIVQLEPAPKRSIDVGGRTGRRRKVECDLSYLRRGLAAAGSIHRGERERHPRPCRWRPSRLTPTAIKSQKGRPEDHCLCKPKSRKQGE